MLRKSILLVNPNRFKSPPVPPLALEYLAGALDAHRIPYRMVDLCFSENPVEDLSRALAEESFDLAAITIHNVDTALFPDTEFFLPAIRDLVDTIRQESAAPVVIGGAALGADPEGILRFVGADTAVVGPGEQILSELSRSGSLPRGILRPEPCAPGACGAVPMDLGMYRKNDARSGFATHTGCSGACSYCIEARTPVRFREPGTVVEELRSKVGRGMNGFHLCDPEFNEDLDYSKRFLLRLIDADLDLTWALYVRPGVFDEELFALLKRSGAHLITLSAWSDGAGSGYWAAVKEMVALARDTGLSTSIDLLTGFPGENTDILKKTLDKVFEARADDVVVNTVLRLYPSLPVTARIKKNPAFHPFVRGDLSGTLLEPVFYCHVDRDELTALIGDRGDVRIAGDEQVVNYQKVK